MIASPSIGYLDRCRRPSRGSTVGAKEWHHVVVYADGLQLLVNLSESHGRYDDGTVRVIVMAHGPVQPDDGQHGWHSAVLTASSDEVAARNATMRRSTLDSFYGTCARFWWDRDHYRLVIDSSSNDGNTNVGQLGIEIDLRLDPVATASMLTGVSLSPAERLSWFFVPRLHATGHVRVGDHSVELTKALAYHDHNWGQFDWGGDYAWEWISAVGQGWSVTASRLLDRTRSTLRSQFLHVETDAQGGAEPVSATFRDAEITTANTGRCRAENVPVVPGALRLITPALVEDVPAAMQWSARRGGDQVALTFTPESIVRLAIPDEVRTDGVVVLAEAVGSAAITATVDGVTVNSAGHSILELLR